MQQTLKPCLPGREAQSFLQDGVVHRGDVGYLGRSLRQIKDGRCWQGLEDGGRLPEVRRVVVLGVEEQGELDLCDRVLTLRVLGHRAGLEWNHDGRWLTGSPDGDDGAVVAILVRMMW